MTGIFHLYFATAFYFYVASAEVICPNKEQSFHRHPGNCSLFIECKGGVAAVLNCIPGLHFDAEHRSCNLPEFAGCAVEDTDCSQEGQENQGNQEIEESDESFVYCPGCFKPRTGIEGDRSCPPTGQHFFPHPYSCSQFIECNNGKYDVIDCITGLHFNSDLGWCDFPENVGCVDSTPTPPTTPVPTTTEAPPLIDGPVGECPPLNGEYVDFLTHSTDCSTFYMCNWGVPIEMNCPSGLHFNPILNVCDWPYQAGCGVA